MMALRTAATGMAAQDLNVDVISNNIANMNTVGYKKQRAEFEDLLYQNTTNATPTPATASRIQQGMLESSNVQPIVQITDLISISRAYESVSQMMSDNSDLSKTAIQRLGSVQ